MLESKSALKCHKTQAQCVVSSPTATPSYLLGEEKKEKSLHFCFTRAGTVALVVFTWRWVSQHSKLCSSTQKLVPNRAVVTTGEKFWSPGGLSRCLCVREREQERWPPFMCSLMSMMMLLMCTVPYAGHVHNHVLGINDFITFFWGPSLFVEGCCRIFLEDCYKHC